MPTKINPGFGTTYVYQKKWHGFGFALILLVIGLFWLLKDTGVISTNISIWSVIFITLGLYGVIAAIIKNVFW